MSKGKNILRKSVKIIIFFLTGLLILTAGLWLYLNTDSGKRMLRNQVQSYLQNKLHSTVSIGQVDYNIPDWISLKNIYIEDQQKDTLLYGEEITVKIKMLGLLKGETSIQDVFINNVFVNIQRAGNNEHYNYQFIADAFSDTSSQEVSTDTASMHLQLDHLRLRKTRMVFKDGYGGQDMFAQIDSLNIDSDQLQPDKFIYNLRKIEGKGIRLKMTSYVGTHPTSDDSGEPIDLMLNLGNTSIADIDISVDDSIAGAHSSNKIALLESERLSFDMKKEKGLIQSVYIKEAAIGYLQENKNIPVVKIDSTETASNWIFKVGKIEINNSSVKYDDNHLKPAAGFDANHIDTKGINCLATGIHFSTDSIQTKLSQLSFKDKSGLGIDSARVNFLMTNHQIKADDLYIKTPNSLLQKSFQLSYDKIDDLVNNPSKSLMDISIEKSTLSFKDIFLLYPDLKKTLPPASFANQNIYLNTTLKGNLAALKISPFQMSGLSGSRLNVSGTLYNILDSKKFAYNITVGEGKFLKSDWIRLVPKEQLASLKDLPELVSLKGSFKGDMKNLSANMQVKAQGINIAGNFQLSNFMNPDKLSYRMDVTNISLDKKLMGTYIPKEMADQFYIPDNITAKGKLNGSVNDFQSDLMLNSSLGNLGIKGFMKNMTDPKKASYDLTISSAGFNIGKFLKQDSLLKDFAGTITAKGVGFDYKTMAAVISTKIDRFDFKGYTYKNASIDASLKEGLLNTSGIVNDDNIRLNYEAAVNLQTEYPVVNATVNIDTIQLKELGLLDNAFNCSGKINFKSEDLRPRHLSASLFLDNFHISTQTIHYPFYTLSLVASSSNGVDSIHFKAPFGNIDAGGAFDYDVVGASLIQRITEVYKSLAADSNSTDYPPQEFGIAGSIVHDSIFNVLIPGLKHFDPIHFAGAYHSAENKPFFAFDLQTNSINYLSNDIKKTALHFDANDKELNASILIDTFLNNQFEFYSTSIHTKGANELTRINILTKDNTLRDWFAMEGLVYIDKEDYVVKLTNNVLLNYEKWNTTSDNYISYSPEGIIVKNFFMSKDSSKIYIDSEEPTPNSPLVIDIDNFDLNNINTFLKNDSTFTKGMLDASISISELENEIPAFVGTASIEDLSIMGYKIGTITAEAGNSKENEITTHFELKENGNEVTAKGKYYLQDEDQEFEANLLVTRLNMETIEAFSSQYLNSCSGNISGEFEAQGKFDAPKWKGFIQFDTTLFTITSLGTPYKIINQTINFDAPVILTKDLVISDNMNHFMKINGGVTISKEMILDVDIVTDDFILVNSKRNNNNFFYGYADADANISIKGTASNPIIEGDILINDKSDLTVMLSDGSYSKDDASAIVKFVDRDTFSLIQTNAVGYQENKLTGDLKSYLNYNLNIEVNKTSSLKIIIDPVTGDEILVQGDAHLNTGVDPGGNIILAGTYELNNGYYNLNYQLLKRQFNLVKGSTIIFSGAPLDAMINMTAEYICNTSAQELLINEVNDASPLLANSFRQKLPFRVLLMLSGKLSAPKINFDIQLPQESNLLSSDLKNAIDNKLTLLRQDQAALNKQVFSLLLLNKFVGNQSSDFFSGSNNDFTGIAMNSVSRFVSSALNQIAGDVLKGIDVDLNLNSYNDFTQGGNEQRTDLNVAVSKSFFDNRLTVSVGNNFGLIGESSAASSNNNNAIFRPDVSVAYKLSKDGKYMMRAYTKNQYEVVLDGYVIENGLSFLVTLDYDLFKELFRKK